MRRGFIYFVNGSNHTKKITKQHLKKRKRSKAIDVKFSWFKDRAPRN